MNFDKIGAGEVKGVQNAWAVWLVAFELLSLVEELHMAHEFLQRARGPECSTLLTFFDRARVGLQITKNLAFVRPSGYFSSANGGPTANLVAG